MNDKYRKVALEAALSGGRLIKRSIGRSGNIHYKGKDNIVTDIDKKVEALIVKKILSAFPDHSILAEETAPTRSSSDHKWIIDPIDGTTNFSRAFPFFCVSIALEERGRIVLGVIYDPVHDELFNAMRGKGAYLNKKKIAVSQTKKLSSSFLATGFSYGLSSKAKNVRNFSNFLVRTLAIRRAGAAALDLCYVACGRFDGFWEMGLKPWDSAAGILIVSEAGGLVTKFDGGTYSHYDDEILASNRFIHSRMVKVLKQKR